MHLLVLIALAIAEALESTTLSVLSTYYQTGVLIVVVEAESTMPNFWSAGDSYTIHCKGTE